MTKLQTSRASYGSPFPPLNKKKKGNCKFFSSHFWLFFLQFWLFFLQFWLFFSEFWDINLQLRVKKSEFRDINLQLRVKKSEFWDINLQLRVTKSEFRDINLQLRVKKSEFWDINLQLRVTKSEFRDINSQFWEHSLFPPSKLDFRTRNCEFISHSSEKKSHNCEIKIRNYFFLFLFFIQWRKRASIASKQATHSLVNSHRPRPVSECFRSLWRNFT